MIPEYIRMDRRESIKWLATAAAALPGLRSLGATTALITKPSGTLTDPELLQPSTQWTRTLSADEIRTLAALCDEIIPADYQESPSFNRAMPALVGSWTQLRPVKIPAATSPEQKQAQDWLDAFSQNRYQRNYSDLPEDFQGKLRDAISPSASQVKVPDFIDEWVSAPYPSHQADRALIREGLAWLNQEARQRFRRAFAEADGAQRRKICDDIAYLPKAKSEHQKPAAFFARVRDLTAAGFYTTKAGMKDLRYVGNVAMQAFKGPPPEVLIHLKLA